MSSGERIWFVEDSGERRRVDANPGVVYHSSIWLEELDLEKAKRILLDHLDSKIEDCERQIDNYRKTIRGIKRFKDIQQI